MGFLTLPVFTWIVCGAIKFCVNYVRYGRQAFDRIGHGGFPSNHAAIISSVMWAFGLIEEWHMAGLAVAVLMIHVFDATGLRREIGYHAVALNKLAGSRLREVVGHKPVDICAGLLIGLAVAASYRLIGIIP